ARPWWSLPLSTYRHVRILRRPPPIVATPGLGTEQVGPVRGPECQPGGRDRGEVPPSPRLRVGIDGHVLVVRDVEQDEASLDEAIEQGAQGVAVFARAGYRAAWSLAAAVDPGLVLVRQFGPVDVGVLQQIAVAVPIPRAEAEDGRVGALDVVD